MSLTLTVTDNADGSGVHASIAGSAPGSTNTFFYQLAPQLTFAPLTWVNAGNITGDGTLAIALNPGYGFFYVQNTDGSVVSVSNIVYSQISWNTDSVLYRVLTAAQAQLQTVVFSGLASSQIQVRYLPRALEQIDWTVNGKAQPLMCIAPVGQQLAPQYLTGLDEEDEPFTVATIVPQNANYNANLRQNTLWRQQVNRRLRNQRLPGIPEMMWVEQLPSALFDQSAFNHLWFLGLSLFRAKTRSTRGA